MTLETSTYSVVSFSDEKNIIYLTTGEVFSKAVNIAYSDTFSEFELHVMRNFDGAIYHPENPPAKIWESAK